jgi:hypothetical protein
MKPRNMPSGHQPRCFEVPQEQGRPKITRHIPGLGIVAQDVRSDAFAPQHWVVASRRRVLAENVGNAVARQRLTMPIEEYALSAGGARHAAQSVQRVGRLGPQRQQPLFLALATQANLPRCSQLQIVPPKPGGFANPSTTVV